MTDPGRRGPACFDGARCHQALHLFSRSLGSQRLGLPGIIGRDDEIWICLFSKPFLAYTGDGGGATGLAALSCCEEFIVG